MSFPSRVQFAQNTRSSVTSNVDTFSISAATAGNLLVVCLAGDKNTGALTVTDNIGTNSGANPWHVSSTEAISIPGTQVSTYIAWKVAVGGETTITATTASNPTSGNTGYCEELSQTGSGAWMVVAKAQPAYNDTARTSAASGTSDTADYDGRAIAIGTVDSVGSGSRTTPSFSNTYTKVNNPPSTIAGEATGFAGCWVATKDIAAGATTDTTFTSSISDQNMCAILVVGRNASGPTAPTVGAGADVTGHVVNTAFSRTATENNNGATITSRAWTITAGPTGVGTTIGTAAALSWTPATVGTYTLQYAATNSAGTGTDSMTIAVVAPDLVPEDVIPIGQASGMPHYAVDIGVRGETSRVLYPPSAIEAGLEFVPEYTTATDGAGNWLQNAVYADAPTTSGTSNPRSEHRETQPGSDSNLGWTPTDGNVHWQRFRAKVMQHPLVTDAGISVGQVHSLDDDILMVRTRVRSNGTVDLVLREYDPGTANSVDVATLITGYTFGDVFDLLFLIRGGKAYVFCNDFVVPVWTTDPNDWPATTTYMFKWGDYNQFRDGQTGIANDDLGRVLFQNVQHFHTGWAAPTNYGGWPTVDLGAAGTATAGQAFTRTMSTTGSGITQYKWAILDGPGSTAGTVIGSAAALSWTPSAPGTYTLIGSAKNAQGWSDPTTLTVTVNAASGGSTVPASVRSRTSGYNAAATSHTISTPVGTQPGDTIFVFATNDGVGTTGDANSQDLAVLSSGSVTAGWETDPTWTVKQGDTTNHRSTLFVLRDAVGGGSDSVTINLRTVGSATAISQELSYVVVVVQSAGTSLVVATANGGSATTGAVTTSGTLTSDDYLSLIFLGLDNGTGGTAHVVTPPGTAPNNWTNLTTGGTSASVVLSHSMDRALLDVTSIAPANVTWTNAEQWITFHVVVPPGPAPGQTIDLGAVDVTLTPQAVTPDHNVVAHPANLVVTVIPQALDNAKAAKLGVVSVTWTPQALDPAKRTDVETPVDVTPTPQAVSFVTGTTPDPADVAVTPLQAKAGKIYDVGPLDLTVTPQAIEAGRGLKASLVNTTVFPLTVVTIVGNTAAAVDTTVEVPKASVGRVHDVGVVDITTGPADADYARQVDTDLVNVSIVRQRTLAYTLDSGPIDVTAQPLDITHHKQANPLVVGVQVTVNQVDGAHIVDVAPVNITMAPQHVSSFTGDTDAFDITVDVLPVEVAFSAEDTPASSGIRQLPRTQPTRVIAQSILTKEWLHWDLAVHDLTISPTLSGATEISGSFPVEIKDYRDLGLEPWGTWIHVEEDGQIRASGILQPTSIDQDEKLSFLALGVSAYAYGIPYMGEYSQIGVDPAQIVRDLWAHMQTYPDAKLGVEVTGQTTVKLGTPEDPEDKQNSGPYELFWWNGTDVGKEIDSLAKETPFDYIERSEWNDDKTEVLHFIDIGFPRIGTRRYDLVFRQDENLLAAIGPEEPDDLFASQVLVLGSGEGRDTIKGYAGRVFGGRVRRVAILDDKTIQTATRAHSLAHLDLERRQALYDIEEITISARHPNAPFGSFLVGDDILIEAEVPWIGRVRQWERILDYTYSPDTEEVRLKLRRSESFIYGTGDT